jgi:acetylornithine deacetylase
MMPVEQLLLDLVAIPSVSVTNNRAVIDYVIGCLDPNTWEMNLDSYVDSAGTPKTNLIALTKNASSRLVELALVCHSDTVPFEASWEEAVHPAIRDGRLYGRGSCDVKGFLACALAALSGVELGTLCAPIALIVTADEEVGCVGAKRLAAEKAFTANYTIIGEPTGLHVIRAGKGYCLASIIVRGKEAHSAFPAKGHSAIYDAARVALLLEGIARDLDKDRDLTFDPPFTTLNVGIVEGGTAKNIVPGECRLLVEWRPIPGQPANYVADIINRELVALRQSFPSLDAELHVQRMDPAFAPSQTQHLVELLSLMTEKPPSTIAFGSEAAHLSALAGETVVFGPGDMTVAHRTGEHVPLAELHACVAHLRSVIDRLCRERVC